MSAPVEVVVHRGGLEATAGAIGSRLIATLLDALAARGEAHVVLTGGTLGIALLAAVRENPACPALDWSRVHVWWGDERFVPAEDPDRNEKQAREALLDHVALDPAHVHPMPASDGSAPDLDAAAGAYADELARHSADDLDHPRFDVVMLGVGPDAHVASLFPGLPGVMIEDRSVIAVTESPKPPPHRISLTLPVIRSATEVWLVVAGADKAQAVADALDPGSDPARVPAVGARGRVLTRVLVDEAAAALLR